MFDQDKKISNFKLILHVLPLPPRDQKVYLKYARRNVTYVPCVRDD